ncbi:MAG: trehalose/maltose transport system substrate-binding protein [Blastococcus sp.]|jgi:multiple sugar transport system substrate-binding protein|nr:trehalose/maltose transport system substrate-binding protein [Blastococcus sp.]
MRTRGKTSIALAASALLLSACSSGGGGTSAGGGNSSATTSHGPITYVQGKDNSNVVRPLVEKWNAAHPTEKVTFKEQTDKADQQHDDLVQHFQAKDPNYDVASVDVVWTAEFAAKGWLQPLKDKLAIDTSQMLQAPVKAATYNNTLFAAPVSSDGGMLYYRKDLVPKPPATFTELLADCQIAKAKNIGCFAGQYAKYEGLTVNAAEFINSAGGQIVKADGKTPSVDSPEAAKGLSALVEAYKAGAIPKEAITFQEEQGRQAFEAGKLLFLRNWPYVYSLAKTDASSTVKNTFGVAPLPGLTGPGASSLGGHSAAISAYSKHQATAVDFLKFLVSDESQKFFATQGSLAPVTGALYTDPALTAKLPYLPTLLESIKTAVPRPVSPFYPAVTRAVQDNAYAALQGQKSVSAALKDMQAAIQAASGG